MNVCAKDWTLQPAAECRPFDFTLGFEFCILIWVPATIAIGLFILRIARLWRRPAIFHRFRAASLFGRCLIAGKLCSGLFWSASALGAVASWAQDEPISGRWQPLLALTFCFVASLLGTATSLLEHTRARRPSLALALCLGASLVCETAFIRTLVITSVFTAHTAFAACWSLSYAARFALFCLENVSKRGLERDGRQLVPEETAGFLSRAFLAWLTPVMLRGIRTELTLDNIGHVSSSRYSEKLHQRFVPAWEKNRGRSMPLIRSLFACAWKELLSPILPCLMMATSLMAMPLISHALLDFVQSAQIGGQEQPLVHGWSLVAANALVLISVGITSAWFFSSVFASSAVVRGILVQAVYRKSLRITMQVAEDVGPGAAAALVSTDIQRICDKLYAPHLLYQMLWLVMLCGILLSKWVGAWAALTVGVALLASLSGPLLAPAMLKAQDRWAASTDTRVKLMSSVLKDIRAVKLCAYEDAVLRKLGATRQEEMNNLRKYGVRTICVTTASYASVYLTIIPTVTVRAFIEGVAIDTPAAWAALGIAEIVAVPLFVIAYRFSDIVQAWSSLHRVEDFLLKDEKVEDPLSRSPSTSSSESDEKSVEGPSDIRLIDATFGWREKVGLAAITATIECEKLTMGGAVVGPVGSGKSVLLQALCGEVDLLDGHFVPPRAAIAYCAQDPWLQGNLTLKANIEFASPPDAERYSQVLAATALDIDIASMPDGDQRRARSLSGGQKARLALARALYVDASLYLLDDPLSALDAITEAHVFNSLFGEKGLLRGKTVLLVTHSANRLQNGDHIIALDGGSVIEQGGYEQLRRQKGYVYNLTKDLNALPPLGSNDALQAAIKGDQPTQALVNLSDDQDIADEVDTARWPGSLIWRFLSCVGLKITIGMLANLLLLCSVIWVAIPLILRYWLESDSQTTTTTFAGYLSGWVGIWTIFLLSQIIFHVFSCIKMPMKAGKTLHDAQLLGVIRSPLAFLESQPLGRLHGRFSQDIINIDDEYSKDFMQIVLMGLGLVGSAVLASIPTPYVAAVLAGCFGTFGIMIWGYSKGADSLRRLDLSAKSPLYDLCSTTVDPNGLRTIRAFGVSADFVDRATARLETSQRPWRAYETFAQDSLDHRAVLVRFSQRWLSLACQSAIIISSVALSAFAVLQRRTVPAQALGAGLFTALTMLSNVPWFLLSIVEFRVCSISLERIQHFASLPAEEMQDVETSHEKGFRIEEGAITFKNVSLRYPGASKLALDGISLDIQAGERVGICGRSGSGKTTTIGALARLLDLESGSIEIDGRDISSVSRKTLRQQITNVPQEPLLLELTLRDNLDLDGEYDDATIWNALEQCSCRDVTEKLPNKLDTHISGEGNTFSRGQRQLLALARALLRKRKIICLDESSSSLDHASDEAVQAMLRGDAFRGCTLLIVAHRTSTIRDCDRVAVWSEGRIVEIGPPQELLANASSEFRKLVEEQEGFL